MSTTFLEFLEKENARLREERTSTYNAYRESETSLHELQASFTTLITSKTCDIGKLRSRLEALAELDNQMYRIFTSRAASLPADMTESDLADSAKDLAEAIDPTDGGVERCLVQLRLARRIFKARLDSSSIEAKNCALLNEYEGRQAAIAALNDRILTVGNGGASLAPVLDLLSDRLATAEAVAAAAEARADAASGALTVGKRRYDEVADVTLELQRRCEMYGTVVNRLSDGASNSVDGMQSS